MRDYTSQRPLRPTQAVLEGRDYVGDVIATSVSNHIPTLPWGSSVLLRAQNTGQCSPRSTRRLLSPPRSHGLHRAPPRTPASPGFEHCRTRLASPPASSAALGATSTSVIFTPHGSQAQVRRITPARGSLGPAFFSALAPRGHHPSAPTVLSSHQPSFHTPSSRPASFGPGPRWRSNTSL